MSKVKTNQPLTREMFTPVGSDRLMSDTKFDTKPIGYFRDAWNRFKKNKASVVAFFIIALIVLFAIVTPLISPYEMNEVDGYYKKCRPKLDALAGSGFWDGGYFRSQESEKGYIYFMAMAFGALDVDGTGDVTWEEAEASEYNPIIEVLSVSEPKGIGPLKTIYRDMRMDSYLEIGFMNIEGITPEEYAKIQAWQEETGIQVLYPLVDINDEKNMSSGNKGDAIAAANYWYCHNQRNQPLDANGRVMTLERVMEEGLTPNYLYRDVWEYVYDENGQPVLDEKGNHLQQVARDENGNKIQELAYYRPMGNGGSTYQIRVLYYNYYQYLNGHEVSHLFGTDAQGYDILIRLAMGCRLSLILSVFVSLICLFLGSLYGAIEGYYGGAVDMIMERITDVLSGVPFIVVTSLFKLHLIDTNKVGPLGGLLFAFVVTGWIGTSYMVRMQFYRFKRQEYILAARTLGASDWRLMFRHIFPNALGTMITSSVLVIPGVIFSETSLAYLGIINFNGADITSLGTMLSNGQSAGIQDYPHILFFPAIILSLLMISFNLFGNGLRDAFNPNMRGVED